MSVEITNIDQSLKLRQSERDYQLLVNSVDGIVWQADAKTFQFSFVSRSALKMLGYPLQKWLDEPTFWKDHIHPDDRERAVAYCTACTKQKKSHQLEYRMIAKDKRIVCIHDNVSVIVEDGKVVLRGIMTDCTERKKEQDEMVKLSMVAKETINGVAIRDKNQNVLWINNAFTKMYGYEIDEVIGKNPLQFLQGPDTNPEVVALINERMAKKVPFTFEIAYYDKGRNKLCVRVQMQPIFDDNGNVIQSFALHTDITEQKRLAEQVELEKIIKHKEITDAVIAAQEKERSEIGRELHDNVNQLLGAIHLYIEMAKKDEAKKEILLNNASNFTKNAIEEIRKLSKTLITPLIKDTGLTAAITDLIEEIKAVHPIKITLHSDTYAEATFTDKFKVNLFRIVQEQVNNILKHAKAEHLIITLEDSPECFLLSIADDGIGFDTTKKKPGIGIANIRSRAELYNGMLQLDSETGKGTALTVTFKKSSL